MNMNILNHGIELLKDSSKYPNIPTLFVNYCKEAFRTQDNSSPLNKAFLNHPEETCVVLDNMFQSASNATGLKPEELFDKTDIKLKDLSPERIESSIGEIRAINFLFQEEFRKITLLKSNKKRKADLTAVKGRYNYAVEVTTSIQSAQNRICSEWILTKLIDDGKLLQLEETAKTLGNSKKMLICVMNTIEVVALNTHSSFLSISKTVWERSGKIKDFHVCIITGLGAEGYESDDCVYPNLS